jgi:endonuclease YncB( thermonuclease family)
MIGKTGHYGEVLFTLPHNKAEGRAMSQPFTKPAFFKRAYIENGEWRITAANTCDAVVQRKATLRVSALAGVVTLALFVGPELRLALPEAHTFRAPLVSQPEMVSFKPADRVPGSEKSYSQNFAALEITSTAPARLSRSHAVEAVTAIDTPRAHPAIDVVDGATLRAGDMVVRLSGMALPQEDRTCKRLDGLAVPCLDRASSYLQLLVKGRAVACDRAGVASDGTDLGRCRVGETDIAEQMIRQGWGRAAEAGEQRLVVAEAAARKQKLGIWRD